MPMTRNDYKALADELISLAEYELEGERLDQIKAIYNLATSFCNRYDNFNANTFDIYLVKNSSLELADFFNNKVF
jgi:hypothetical protein